MRSEFLKGVRDIAPMAVAYAPIAFLWGTLAAEQNLGPLQAFAMSAWVYSGAAQFVSLELLASGTPLALITFTIVTVSLRHVLMSASISRAMTSFTRWKASFLLFWLTDEAWAMLEHRASSQVLTPAYFFGVAFPIWPVWFGFASLGAVLGNQFGDISRFGLDFAFAAMFIAVLAGFWKGTRSAIILIVSALVAVLVKLTVPGAWYIISGGLAGMAVAVFMHPKEQA